MQKHAQKLAPAVLRTAVRLVRCSVITQFGPAALRPFNRSLSVSTCVVSIGCLRSPTTRSLAGKSVDLPSQDIFIFTVEISEDLMLHLPLTRPKGWSQT